MIQVNSLVKDFGDIRAVDDVTFEVGKGSVVGFLGPNGAGKTTTMRMITGFLPPTSGTVTVLGRDMEDNPVEARTHIGYLPENAPLYSDMTVDEFLRFIAEIRGYQGGERKQRVDAVIDRCFLKSVRHQSIDTLSKGYRQRTCFAQALIHDPDVLLLDEPTDGLDPNQKQVVREMIREMAEAKIILFSTHILEEVEAVCSRALIISNGRIVEDGTPLDLKKKSPSYNTVTLTVPAGPDEAKKTLAGLRDVDSLEVLNYTDAESRLKLKPKDRTNITATVIDACREKSWSLQDLQTDGGRLDEVFRERTDTADVQVSAAVKGEA